MSSMPRRDFLRLAGAAAGTALLPPSIRRALAIPANSVSGTIDDVEHIVVLMQENRSFDHYFGSLRGVRGFDDPRAITLRDGRSVWQQRSIDGFQLPFRPVADNLGLQFLQGTPHDWQSTQQALNGGNYDRWIAAKGRATMAYLTREDIPFHYALADAFTICDAYHCSVLGPTDPNRYYLWTGHAGNDGAGGGPVLDNSEAGYRWTTYPERLERAGIAWKIYQDIGNGLDAGNYWGWTATADIGNYGNNSLLYFDQYRQALPGSALFEKARRGTQAASGDGLFDILRADVAADRLPQVSWIVAPEAYSEHPDWPANYGAWYVAQVLDALTANPSVWSKTALFLTYDENDGFFDHVVPPVAAASRAGGLSSIDTRGEFFAGNAEHVAGSFGLGVRVPMLVISPWSRGGVVNSQLFDHTSIIRFIEQRFGRAYPEVIETQVSAWRRAVCGDLTSAFDFANPYAALPELPGTAAYRPQQAVRQNPCTPAASSAQGMPRQETGVRRASALPYQLAARCRCTEAGAVQLDFQNDGTVGAVFQVRSANRSDGPWTYSVKAGRTLSDLWSAQTATQDAYDFSVHGPNGFLRHFRGALGNPADGANGRAEPDVQISTASDGEMLQVILTNPGLAECMLEIVDGHSRRRNEVILAPQQIIEMNWNLRDSLRWYDLTVRCTDNAEFLRHFAGKVENGQAGFSDPAIGRSSA